MAHAVEPPTKWQNSSIYSNLNQTTDNAKESIETYLLELTPYKGLCVVVSSKHYNKLDSLDNAPPVLTVLNCYLILVYWKKTKISIVKS